MAQSRPLHAISGWTGDTIQAVLDAVPDAMLAVDHEGAIVRANVQAEELFGYPRPELVGLPVEVLIPERIQTLHATHRADYFLAPRDRPMHTGIEFSARRSDGTEVPVEISLRPLETEDGVLVLSAIRDISARKRAEAQRRELEELNRMKTELLHVLSHEIFTPVTTIQGTALALLHSPAGLEPKALHELTTGLEHAVERLRRLMRNLDVAARLQEDTLALSMFTMRVGDILDRALEEFPGGVALGLIRSAAPDEALDRILPADVDLVARALVIVIENALAYSQGQQVDIELRVDEDEALILVSDRGPGIPAEMLERIFEPFEQVDSSATRSHEGLGFGLFIARGVMRAQGGDVDVRSRDGGGATFGLHVPMTQKVSL